jgi:histidyl-tRNA synthetase
VAQHRGSLAFPFKRYQIQKVWRGERPQQGRYREFYQADIDVIGEGELPVHFDAEMALLLHEVVSSLPIPRIVLRINNRKVLEGFYRAIGIERIGDVLRTVDKLDKIGEDGVRKALLDENELSRDQAERCLALARIGGEGEEVVEQVRALGASHALLDEGLEELAFVMRALKGLPAGSVRAELRIARGLDYYTGTVYEGVFVDHPQLGAVCSGGRYDNLASDDKNKLPGVGVSIGLSRILGFMFANNQLKASRATPTLLLIALNNEEERPAAYEVARKLRERGLPTEVFHAPQKFGKQIRYAERKGIPYVVFVGAEGLEIKDIRSGAQGPLDASTWTPPEDDLKVRILRGAQ